MINTIQIYNWFSKRYIQLVLILYFLVELLGYSTPSGWGQGCTEAAQPFFYLLYGCIMIVFGLLDVWLFYFNPLQKNFFLDQAQHDERPKREY